MPRQFPALLALLDLPRLPGRFRWERTASGYRIYEDRRAVDGSRPQRGHFTEAVLKNVILGEPLETQSQIRRAAILRDLLNELGVSIHETEREP